MGDLYLKPLAFNTRIGKYFMNAHYINRMYQQGNLQNILLALRLDDFSEISFKEMMSDRIWAEPLSEAQKIEKFKLVQEKAKKDYTEDVNNFLLILFNQTLVMFCTVFDTFLEDCLEVITSAKADALKLLSMPDNRDILKAIEKNTDPNSLYAVYIIRKTILKEFGFKNIEKKLNTFERLGLGKDIIFKLNDIMSLKYPNAYEFLQRIYKKRNDIVHKDTLVLKSYEDLANIENFLTHFIFHFSSKTGQCFGIPLDIALIASGKHVD